MNEVYNIDFFRLMLSQNGESEQAEKMSSYMQNKFEFAGIPKPKLSELIRQFLKDTSKAPIDWSLVLELWACEYREAQYVALEYIGKHQRELQPEDIGRLKVLITEKSWWETVDTIDAFVGEIVKKEPSLKQMMLSWASSDNIWLRRVAIDFQQEYKTDTDTDILEKIILLNLGSNEFFINKAIGWSLRDYSKVNPDWVMRFLENHKEKMASLSIKEASKYL